MFNLKIVSKKTGFNLKKSDILLRQSLVGVVCILGGFFVSFIIPIAFIVALFINKSNQSIDDFLTSTIVYENVQPNEDEKEQNISFEIENFQNNNKTKK